MGETILTQKKTEKRIRKRRRNMGTGIGKRGQGAFVIIILLIVMLFAISIVNWVGSKVQEDVNTNFQTRDDISEQAKNVSATITQKTPGTMDSIIAIMLGLMWIGALVAAWFSDTNPFIIIVMIFLILMISIAAGYISNTWDAFSSESEFTGFSTNYPVTTWVLDNYMLVAFIMLGSTLGVALLKNRFL